MPGTRPIVGIVARAAVLCVAGAGLGFAANAVRPDGLRLTTYEPPLACSAPGVAAAEHETTIAPERAQRLCGRADVVILDTRPADRFALGHVASAVHLPCDAAGHAAHSALGKLDRAGTVVVYGEGDEDAEPVLASLRSRLGGRGDTRVLRLEGGFRAWERASLSCASGPCAECREASHP